MTPYAEFVKGLFKDGELIMHDIVALVRLQSLSRLHAVIGIVGEIGEFRKAVTLGSQEHIQEEAGDLVFYTEALYQNLPPLKHVAVCFDSSQAEEVLLNSALELLDLAKKEVIYAKPLSDEQLVRYERHYQLVALSIQKLIRDNGLNFQTVIEANVTKLRKRYPGATYSNQAAAARLDKIGAQDDNS